MLYLGYAAREQPDQSCLPHQTRGAGAVCPHPPHPVGPPRPTRRPYRHSLDRQTRGLVNQENKEAETGTDRGDVGTSG